MYVPTHQLLVSTMYPTCTSTKIPHQFHHLNMICNSVIDLVYMITVEENIWNDLTQSFSDPFKKYSVWGMLYKVSL